MHHKGWTKQPNLFKFGVLGLTPFDKNHTYRQQSIKLFKQICYYLLQLNSIVEHNSNSNNRYNFENKNDVKFFVCLLHLKDCCYWKMRQKS